MIKNCQIKNQILAQFRLPINKKRKKANEEDATINLHHKTKVLKILIIYKLNIELMSYSPKEVQSQEPEAKIEDMIEQEIARIY
jgi:hypothetical protein